MLDCAAFKSETKSAMAKHILATTLAILLITTSARADSNDERLRRLHDLTQCPIFAYLAAIHRAPINIDNRYLVVIINHRGDQRFYAQCAFEKRDHRMHCEVSSPYFNPGMYQYFQGEHLKSVKSLGYRRRVNDNYYQKRNARRPEAIYDIAGLLIDTLGRVFDMQPEEGLIYEAPLVKQLPAISGADGSKLCAPMISLR